MALEQVFPGLPKDPDAVEEYIKRCCEGTETIQYTRYLTPEELNDLRAELAEVDIKLEQLEDEKKDAVAEINENIRAGKKARKDILEKVKKQCEEIKGNTYKVYDDESKMIGYYDEQGILVSSRRARADERQSNVFAMAGNDY